MTPLTTYFIIMIAHNPATGETITKSSLPQVFTHDQCLRIAKATGDSIHEQFPNLKITTECKEFN